jgi:hypothetical protein
LEFLLVDSIPKVLEDFTIAFDFSFGSKVIFIGDEESDAKQG